MHHDARQCYELSSHADVIVHYILCRCWRVRKEYLCQADEVSTTVNLMFVL